MGRAYECRGCGIRRLTEWIGACANCGRRYNIRPVHTEDPGAEQAPTVEGELVPFRDVKALDVPRLSTLMRGVDRVLGGRKQNGFGFAPGQIVMISGDPGAGKTTLLIQFTQGIAKQRKDVIYITGEQTPEDLKDYADRVGELRSNAQVVRERELDAILNLIEDNLPYLVVIDSIQTVKVEDFTPGSSEAVRTAADEIADLCKAKKIACVFVVQITKSGNFAGPKAVEHAVDTNLELKNVDRSNSPDRELKVPKNRFGTAPAVQKLRMTERGLIEIGPPAVGGVVPDDFLANDSAEESLEIESPDKIAQFKPKGKKSKEVVTTTKSQDSLPAEICVPVVSEADSFWLEVQPSEEVSSNTEKPPYDLDKVLSVDCQQIDCRGQKGRACTSSSGVREAGFHGSRIAASKTVSITDTKTVPLTEKESHKSKVRIKQDKSLKSSAIVKKQPKVKLAEKRGK